MMIPLLYIKTKKVVIWPGRNSDCSSSASILEKKVRRNTGSSRSKKFQRPNFTEQRDRPQRRQNKKNQKYSPIKELYLKQKKGQKNHFWKYIIKHQYWFSQTFYRILHPQQTKKEVRGLHFPQMFSIFVGRHIEHGSVSLFSQWNLENSIGERISGQLLTSYPFHRDRRGLLLILSPRYSRTSLLK